MNNPCLEVVTTELDNAGVQYRVEMGGKHIRVQYGLAYEHLHVVSATPSDWRAPLNERASIRRALREQGFVSDAIELVAEDHLVRLVDGEATCTSLDIAERFSKIHRDVIRAIENTIENLDPDFNMRNFAQIEYQDQKGRKYKAYRLTRNGFSLIAMGFTGAAALEWKVKYIAAFDAMEGELRKISSIDHSGEIQSLRLDFEALTSLVLETVGNLASDQNLMAAPKQKRQFIRPSLLRHEKRLRRAIV